MPKIVDYKLIEVHVDDPKTFNLRVREFISKGWQPYGSPFLGFSDEDQRRYISQSMVRYDDGGEDAEE